MKLYNTLTKQIDQIVPIAAPTVTIYTCGPTVYDYPHIGNWFTFIRYDLLVRTLKASGLEPSWVMNITDVGHLVSDADDGEDKLEKGAKREGKTAWDVAKFYGDYFEEALRRLNFTPPQQLPKATDHIPEQLEMIKLLEDKGFTYIIDDGVYYDTAKFPDYAKFAQLDLDEQQAGKRVEFNQQKRNASDFALWKFSPQDEQRDMEWDSPWGKGFPGWHIECSAMSRKYLGDTLDIHSGGIDHIPVHHTNEIAQSQGATGQIFANTWMHTNHILINDEKIAKSAGNGITLEQIEERGFELEVLRLHVLESHYRSQSKFSWESLEAARNRLNGYRAMADVRFQYGDDTTSQTTQPDFTVYQSQMENALTGDLNTPQVLAILSNVSDQVAAPINQDESVNFEAFLGFVDEALGLTLLASQDITADQKQIIRNRNDARQAANWAKSDQLRDALVEQKIGLRDTPSGAIWFRL